MPGFIANHFASMEKYLLHEMRDGEKSSPLPSLILCHSPIEIVFLKQFFSDHRCACNHFLFNTFDTFMGEMFNKFLPEYPIVSLADLKILAYNKQIYLNSNILSRFFSEENCATQQKIDPDTFGTLRSLEQQIQALNWETPRQALEKITAHAFKLFTKCILFGFSSRDCLGVSFLKLLQKIAHYVTFFAFDWGNSEFATFERLESILGPAENMRENGPEKNRTAQYNFVLVDDPIDAARHIQALLSPAKIAENTGIICPSPSFATLVAHRLEAAQIPFHSGFPSPVFTSRDNLVFAWHRWQIKNDLESFTQFCIFLQCWEPNLFPQNIDISKILTKTFDDYPSLHGQDLADFSKNPCRKNIFERYPMLGKNGQFHEFSEKTDRIIPGIAGVAKHFPPNFPVTKKAFLDYAFHRHFKASIDTSSLASVFLLDPLSASQLQFDKMIIFFKIFQISHRSPFHRSGLKTCVTSP
jgi:hypothetical protein